MTREVPGFWFLTFANSGLCGMIRNPLKRIRRQAEAMGVFGDRLCILTEDGLDDDFRRKFRDRLVPGSRGYGYWCWKPQIVLQTLRKMDDGDVLLYADAGCHLNPQGVGRLKEYFELAREHGIVAFQARAMDVSAGGDAGFHFLPDGEWCKGDILDYFAVRENSSVTATGQLGETAFLVCKSGESVDFFNEFRRLFEDHFELCDDSPSKSPDLPGFIENSHDQSVFSLLGKTRNVFSLSCAEYALVNRYAPENQKHDRSRWPASWSDLAEYPVWTLHDKGGVRSLFPGWFKDFTHRITGNRI